MSSETKSTKRRYRSGPARPRSRRRLRVIDAAVIDLHGGRTGTYDDLGDRRAGGRCRATVYSHFPDERVVPWLLGRLAGRNFADPSTWDAIADPAARLEAALDAFGWYEQVEPMLSAVLRDTETVPVVAELQAERLAFVADIEDRLASGWGAPRQGCTYGLRSASRWTSSPGGRSTSATSVAARRSPSCRRPCARGSLGTAAGLDQR